MGPRAESEFGENALDVAFGGALGDDQTLRDLTIRQAALDQLGNFEFSLGQQRCIICAPWSDAVTPDTKYEIDHVVEITEPMRDVTFIGHTSCAPRWRMPFSEPR